MNKIIFIFFVLIISCKSELNKDKNLDNRNIELTDSTKEVVVKNNPINSTKKTQTKRLMYLYYSNAGLWAFYNNGTYTMCSRCDLLKQNIKNMYNEEPTGNYDILGARLVTENNEFSFDEENNWAMIYYEWKISVDE